MKTSALLLALALLTFSPRPSAAQAAGGASDGRIVESAPYLFPVYEQLPGWAKRIYTKESYEALRDSPDLELIRVRYMSDGLKVVGFIYKPKATQGRKLPAIIWNRGGVGEDAKIGNANFHDAEEMYRYASAGFVVLAPQYRGTDGGEGRDEMGGADLDDVMNLVPLARSLGYVDMNRLFIWGFSRGAQMALQAVAAGLPVKAAVVVGAPTDWETALRENPGLINFIKQTWPDWEARREEHIKRRSAILWAEKINVPVLLLNGGADPAFSPRQVMAFAQRLGELGKLYELTVYAKDDHPVTLNREDRIRRTIDWFENVRRMSVAQALEKTVREQGIEAAVKQYHTLRRDRPEAYDFGEAELNRLGYTLLAAGRAKEAVEIFKLNAETYPASANVYDSLAEAYLAAGERELAVKNYKRSLELNPQNANAAAALKKLVQK